MKLLTVVGARPQFIKAAALSRSLNETAHTSITERIVHTGQHYDDGMSRVFFDELEIPEPRVNLGCGDFHDYGAQLGAMISGIDAAIRDWRPDCLLVYGDTNSTLAGALAAARSGTALAHVEAGLRSFRRAMPEEINRILTDRLSDYLFCPTETALQHLRAEGRKNDVFLVGDVMFDVFKRTLQTMDRTEHRKYNLEKGKYVLTTVHRAENTDDRDRLSCIFEALADVSMQIPVVLPIHPRTKIALQKAGIVPAANIRIVDPLPYKELMSLLLDARAIATDSGGLQKEAYFAAVPCVTLRDETEWTETIDAGWNRLAPPHPFDQGS